MTHGFIKACTVSPALRVADCPYNTQMTIEAMQKVADGQATKIIIPSEMQGLVGLANGIVEGTKQ